MSKNQETMCSDPTQDITICIPCVLAERVAAYAKVCWLVDSMAANNLHAIK